MNKGPLRRAWTMVSCGASSCGPPSMRSKLRAPVGHDMTASATRVGIRGVEHDPGAPHGVEHFGLGVEAHGGVNAELGRPVDDDLVVAVLALDADALAILFTWTSQRIVVPSSRPSVRVSSDSLRRSSHLGLRHRRDPCRLSGGLGVGGGGPSTGRA